MKPDSMLVEPRYIVGAQQDLARQGSGPALNDLAQAEPALASFIHEGLAAVAGKLALSGAPTELIQGAHEEVLEIVLTALRALRRSHYELWKDTVTGTRLAQLDPSLRKRSLRPPKKQSGSDAATGSEGPR